MNRISIDQYIEKYHDKEGFQSVCLNLTETEASDCRLPHRNPVSHKYSYGRALVIAGSLGFSGAPVLTANACERSGAGLTHLMIPDCIYTVGAARCDGSVVTPMESTEKGQISSAALPKILQQLKKAKACVIGPGLGTGTDVETVVKAILKAAECPVVLDADALTACATDPGLLDACTVPVILTPHEGEFKCLGGNLSAGRLAGVLDFTKIRKAPILILKGYGTLVCRGEEVAVNPTGGPAMAKGGSGDVLSGILCALLAQGFEPWLAARCAVYLHGLAGDLAEAELGEYSVTASDLIQWLPAAFRMLSEE